jgi:hypothetical protein
MSTPTDPAMSGKREAAKSAAIARSNLNVWATVEALMENGLLSGPSAHYYKASCKVIKIAQAQMQAELKRYDDALGKVAQ